MAGPDGKRRVCRAVADWPAADRASWDAGLRPGDLLDEAGPAAGWSAATRSKTAKGYGAWLSWLDERCLLDPSLHAADRVTRERVQLYLADLGARRAAHTVHCRLQELGDALRVLASSQDWGWVLRAAGRLRSRATPVRDIEVRMRSPDELLQLGLSLMEAAQLEQRRSPLKRAARYRDGLLIALLACRPLRLRNLAMIEIDRHLQRLDRRWVLVFEAAETKTHRPLEQAWPDRLVPHLERYLDHHRSTLLTRQDKRTPMATARLWISQRGRPLGDRPVYALVTHATAAAFGTPVNPHAFRHAAATAVAIADPEHVGISRVLLGQDDRRTAERYYNLAKAADAARRFHDVVKGHRHRAASPGTSKEPR
jgi:site-specific recombinase XerD